MLISLNMEPVSNCPWKGQKQSKVIQTTFHFISLTHISLSDTVARVREYILSNPEIRNDKSKFILGGGWDHTVWPTGGWPSAVRSPPRGR